MKQTGICPKCSSKKIGFLENVINRSKPEGGTTQYTTNTPAPVGIMRSESQGFIKVIKEEPAGELEAYFCASCGFFETYIKDPTNLQFDTIIGFKWVNPAG